MWPPRVRRRIRPWRAGLRGTVVGMTSEHRFLEQLRPAAEIIAFTVSRSHAVSASEILMRPTAQGF
jgi:hypothetical protein